MGNGLGIAKVFLKYEAKIIILDYTEELKSSILKLREEYPNRIVSGYKIDIRDNNNVKACVEDIINKFGKIDVLVNNTRVCRLEAFENMSDEVRNFHFDINIKATWNVTKALAVELVNNKIRVNSILPGYILTPMVESMSKISNPEKPNVVIDGIAGVISMRRLGIIEELGNCQLSLQVQNLLILQGMSL